MIACIAIRSQHLPATSSEVNYAASKLILKGGRESGNEAVVPLARVLEEQVSDCLGLVPQCKENQFIPILEC